MKTINYEEIESIFNDYIKKWTHMLVKEEINDIDLINYYLEMIIEDNKITAHDIHNLRIYRLKDYDIYYYSIKKDGLSNNIILAKDERKILSVKQKTTASSKVNSSISTFCIYENDNYEPKTKFTLHKLELGNVVVNKIIIMDKKIIPLPRKRSVYDRKEFKIYTQDDEVLCMKKGKDDYHMYEEESTIIDSAIKLIEDRSKKFISIIDSKLNQKKKLKEYKIKRKFN